ncbi:MAG: MFS transporter [Chloroflexi bacterium]|nr:MFS transporter [Chloroflexota bacterium]
MSQPPAAWRIILPLGIGTALSLMGDALMYAVLPTHTAVAGVTLVSVGILLSVNRWVRLAANNVIGWLSDRQPKRQIFVAALFLGALSTAVYAFTSGFWPLFAGRLLWGIAWAGIWVAGNGIILTAAPLAVRGRWVGYYQISFFLGAATGAFLGGLLTDWLGYHQAMMVAAALSLLGAAQAWLFVPREIGDLRLEIDGRSQQISNRQSPISTPIRWPELISATAVLGINRLVIAGIFVSTLGLYLAGLWGESVQVYGRTIGVATLTGLALGANTLISMIFTPLIGSLSDRAGNRWQVVGGGLIPGIVGFGLLALSLPFALLLGLPLTSITSSSNQGLSTALMGDLSGGKRHGRSLGALYTVGDLGSAIGPMLAFAVLPTWGISTLYGLNAVLFAGLLMMALYWVRAARSTTD